MSEGPERQQHWGRTEARRIASSSTSCCYAAARLLLVVVLTGAIYGVARLLGVTQFPIVVAVLFALIIAMPAGHLAVQPAATARDRLACDRRRTPASGTRTTAGPAARREPVR